MKKNIQPIYARAQTMAEMLGIGLTLFTELVSDNTLPSGINLRKNKNATKVWKIEDVCARVDSLKSADVDDLDEFDKALLG